MPKKRWSQKSNNFFPRLKLPNRKLLLSIIGLLLIGFILWCGIKYLLTLRIKTFSCTTQFGNTCPEEISNSLESVKDRPIIYPIDKLLISLKSKFGQIQSFKVKKVFPEKLEITLYLSKPIVAVTPIDITQKQWYLLDNNFRIVGRSEGSTNLPQLELSQNHWKFSDHKLSSETARQSVILLIFLSGNFSPIFSKITSGEDLEVGLGNLSVLFAPTKDPSVSVATLQLALRDPTIQKNPPKVIDLRFQNPVLSY